MRIVVLGYVVRGGMGGMAWHYLQYVLGLARMHHTVHYIEDSGDDPWSCYDPQRDVTDDDPRYGLAFMDRSARHLGMEDRWAYYDARRDRWHGPIGDRAVSICNEADLILNVSGANVLRGWFDDVGKRVFVDTDPAFTQARNLVDPSFRARAAGHNVFLTFGESIGSDGCLVPDDGFAWRTTRQPVVLDAWALERPPRRAPFSTVMQWQTKNSQEYKGVRYGTKEDSFAPFSDLPGAVNQPLELAVGGKGAPRDRLRRTGWMLRDPREVASDLVDYQRYIRSSLAEFSVAKHGYVSSRSGWFSERSVCYLASGRPVVTQETGFTAHLPSGRGLLAYESPEEAIEAINGVCSSYASHARAAREIAASCFDHESVLTEVLERAF